MIVNQLTQEFVAVFTDQSGSLQLLQSLDMGTIEAWELKHVVPTTLPF
jgi:hypothetical protein